MPGRLPDDDLLAAVHEVLQLITRLSVTSSADVPWPAKSTGWAVGLTGNLISWARSRPSACF